MDVGDGNVLNVVRDGKSQRAQPELGIRDQKWIEIGGTDLKEPLQPGEQVIVEGGHNLPEGTAVTLKGAAAESAGGNKRAKKLVNRPQRPHRNPTSRTVQGEPS